MKKPIPIIVQNASRINAIISLYTIGTEGGATFDTRELEEMASDIGGAITRVKNRLFPIVDILEEHTQKKEKVCKKKEKGY